MYVFLCKYRFVLIIFIFFAVTGCSVAPPKPSVTTSLKGLTIYSSTSDRQSAFLKSRESEEHFCDSRLSDVADTESKSIGFGFSGVGNSESINDGASRGAVSLGGRSPAVLITREVMYRTCEMVMNLDLTKEEAVELYVHTLDLVKSVAQSDTSTGTASIVGSAPLGDTTTSAPKVSGSTSTVQEDDSDLNP